VPLRVAPEKYSIVNILFTPPRYFGNRKSGFPCFSSWIFPTIQFHASLSNLPPVLPAAFFLCGTARASVIFRNCKRGIRDPCYSLSRFTLDGDGGHS
jgi:hypothetical protein